MATSTVTSATGSTSVVSESKTVRFWPALDLVLLKEVISIKPKNDTKLWEEVAANVNKILKMIRPSSCVSVRACKNRKQDLLQKFLKDELLSLRASGTDEEYTEREQLLTEINNFETEEKDKTSNIDKKKLKQGEDVRRMTMVTVSKRPDIEETEMLKPPPKKRRDDQDNYVAFLKKKHDDENKLKWEQLQLDKKKFELEKMERESRIKREERMIERLFEMNKK